MTQEELLRPRYKVIADYPKSPFKIGDILPKALETDWRYLDEEMQKQTLSECEKYPALFKKLEWWEDRDEKDIPEYVKSIHSGIIQKVYAPISKDGNWFFNGIANSVPFKNFLPATEEEYINQINKS